MISEHPGDVYIRQAFGSHWLRLWLVSYSVLSHDLHHFGLLGANRKEIYNRTIITGIAFENIACKILSRPRHGKQFALVNRRILLRRQSVRVTSTQGHWVPTYHAFCCNKAEYSMEKVSRGTLWVDYFIGPWEMRLFFNKWFSNCFQG